MKFKITFLILGVLIQLTTNSQPCFTESGRMTVDFESIKSGSKSSPYKFHIKLGTAVGKKNQWQIGQPLKDKISKPYKGKHVIITDSLQPYVKNDTSSFTIETTLSFGSDFVGAHLSLHGWYWVESDSLKDYGKIEVSADSGNTWLDMLDPKLADKVYWISPKPLLTGSSKGWKRFESDYGELRKIISNRHSPIWFRFTFITDSISNSTNGLAFDFFDFCVHETSIEDYIKTSFSSSAYPNPAQNQISFEIQEFNQENFQLKVYNSAGKLVKEQKEINAENPNLPVADLPNGIYFYQIFSEELNKHSTGKFLIQR